MINNSMNFTEQAKTDKALRKRAYKIVKEVRKNGIPKTLDELTEMYDVYNQVYGKRKKVNNCINCRKNVFLYLEKSVQLLDMEPKKPKPIPISRQPKQQTKADTPKAKTVKPKTRTRKPRPKKRK